MRSHVLHEDHLGWLALKVMACSILGVSLVLVRNYHFSFLFYQYLPFQFQRVCLFALIELPHCIPPLSLSESESELAHCLFADYQDVSHLAFLG